MPPPNMVQRAKVMGKRNVEDNLGKMMVKRISEAEGGRGSVHVWGTKIEYEIRK